MKGSEKQSLKINLELIKKVHDNFGHIIEMEQLEDLFLNSKMYFKNKEEIISKHYDFLLKVTRDTISSHYNKNKNFLLIDDVLEEFKDIYGSYDDDIEFDLLNEFEKNM